MAKSKSPAKSAAPAKSAKKGNKSAAPAKKTAAKKAPSGDLSAAISASWADPKVRAARSERTAVKVGGVEYSSVPMAFAELKLPMGRMVRFRKELKAAGKAVFDNDGKKHTFTALAAA